MEQRLDATYLRPDLFGRVAAIGIGALAIGMSILLAAWGISLLWRYTPPEIAVRIIQGGPLTVTPLTGELTIKPAQPSPPITSGIPVDSKTAAGDAIRREVTVFSSVRHGPG